MKKLLIALTALSVLLSTSIKAKDEHDQVDINELMQRLENIQRNQPTCNSNIDHAYLDKLFKQGDQKNMEVIAICNSGDWDRAEYVAREWSLKMIQDKEYVNFLRCNSPIDLTDISEAELAIFYEIHEGRATESDFGMEPVSDAEHICEAAKLYNQAVIGGMQ